MGLRPPTSWNCGLASLQRLCMLSGTGRSLVQWSPTECLSAIADPQQSGGLGPLWALEPQTEFYLFAVSHTGINLKLPLH